MIKGRLSRSEELKRIVKVLGMKPAEKSRQHKRMARKVLSFSRVRIRQQKDLQGKDFSPRKSRQSKKKMLRGLSKQMVAFGDSKKGTVGFKVTRTGRIARAHQEGDSYSLSASDAKKKGNENYDAASTRKQAKDLLNAGFKIRRKRGSGYKRASQKWILDNLKQGQAGLILKAMLDEQPKSNWRVNLPARSFLGANAKERENITDFIFSEQRRKLKKKA